MDEVAGERAEAEGLATMLAVEAGPAAAYRLS